MQDGKLVNVSIATETKKGSIWEKKLSPLRRAQNPRGSFLKANCSSVASNQMCELTELPVNMAREEVKI